MLLALLTLAPLPFAPHSSPDGTQILGGGAVPFPSLPLAPLPFAPHSLPNGTQMLGRGRRVLGHGAEHFTFSLVERHSVCGYTALRQRARRAAGEWGLLGQGLA